MKPRTHRPMRVGQRFRANETAAENVKARTSPLDFYTREVGPLSGHGAWRSARCPWHAPDRHPSLRVNVEMGAFKCMACGVHGGDVVAFLMRRDGLTFRDAMCLLTGGE
jgi:DNA primase